MAKNKNRERKYIGIRGYHADKLLKGDKTQDFRTVAMATTPEYTLSGDIKQVGKTINTLEKIDALTATRDIRKTRALLALKPKSKITAPREERIAEMATRFGGAIPHKYTRYGFLVAKHPERQNPTRPASSQGKIGNTQFSNFDVFNRNWAKMEKALLLLTKDRVLGKDIRGKLAGLKKQITTTVSK